MRHLPYFILLSLFIISCGGSKKASEKTAPIESDFFVPPDIYSNININYKISKKSLTDTFNFIIDEMSKEELKFPDYDVIAKLKRNGNVIVEFSNRDVLVTLPMDVDVTKKTFLKDLKANGTLELHFASKLNIGKDWSFFTKTTMVDYNWTKHPKLGLGLINLPIETLSNMVLNKIKPDLEASIDASMKEQYNLKEIIQEIANLTFTPFELDSVFGGWMQMTTDSAYMSGAMNTKSYSEGKISLKSKMNVTSQKPLSNAFNVRLPVFSWKDNIKDSSVFRLLMEVEYAHLTAVARKNFIGKKFNEGNRSIEVIDVVLGKKDGKFQVSTVVKGSFNGTLSLMGVPAFDKAKSILYAKNVDVAVKTGNVLHSAAAWLLQGKIKSELDKMLQFNIGENFINAQTQVDALVKEMNKKYSMKMIVKLGSINVDNFVLRPDRANVYISMNLKIDTTLDDLGMFRD